MSKRIIKKLSKKFNLNDQGKHSIEQIQCFVSEVFAVATDTELPLPARRAAYYAALQLDRLMQNAASNEDLHQIEQSIPANKENFM